MTTMWSLCHLRRFSGPAVMLLVVACNDSEVTSPSSGALQVVPPASGILAATGHIAFVRNADIYVMNADGSGVRRVTNTSTVVEQQPAWSPNGAKIAFVSNRAGNDEIYTMNADGTGVIRLTHDDAVDGAPAWSPDGTKIAFHSNRDGHFKIYVMKANGAGVTLLTKTLFSQCTHITPTCPAARAPAWSPDGKKIAFIHRFGDFGATSIDVVNFDGSGVIRLAGAPLAMRVSWSHTGKIAIDRYSVSGKWDVFTMKADGTGLTQLTHDTTSDENPSWSPDATRLAFESNRTGAFEIYTMTATGSGVTRLTHLGDQDPAWGP